MPRNLATVNIVNNRYDVYIREYAFYNLKQVTTVNFEGKIKGVGNYAFAESGITSITIPSSVTSVGTGAFSYCSSLTDAVIKNNVTSNYEFRACTNLENVSFEGSSMTLVTNAFYDCSKISSLHLGSNITTLQQNAFSGCSGVTDLYIARFAETKPMNMFGSGSNSSKMNLTYIYSSANNSADSWSMPKNMNVVVDCDIPANAFRGYESGYRMTIQSLTLTDNVTSIGNYAFYNTNILDGDVKLPHLLAQGSIGTQAFAKSSITSISIPESFTQINNDLFKNCTSLTTVYYEYNTHKYEFNYVSNNVFAETKDNQVTDKYFHAGSNLVFEKVDMANEVIRDSISGKFYIDNGDGTFFDAGKDKLLGTSDDMRFIPSYETTGMNILAYVGNNGSWYVDYLDNTFATLQITGTDSYTYQIGNKRYIVGTTTEVVADTNGRVYQALGNGFYKGYDNDGKISSSSYFVYAKTLEDLGTDSMVDNLIYDENTQAYYVAYYNKVTNCFTNVYQKLVLDENGNASLDSQLVLIR